LAAAALLATITAEHVAQQPVAEGLRTKRNAQHERSKDHRGLHGPRSPFHGNLRVNSPSAATTKAADAATVICGSRGGVAGARVTHGQSPSKAGRGRGRLGRWVTARSSCGGCRSGRALPRLNNHCFGTDVLVGFCRRSLVASEQQHLPYRPCRKVALRTQVQFSPCVPMRRNVQF
jgi:hypothetical protein